MLLFVQQNSVVPRSGIQLITCAVSNWHETRLSFGALIQQVPYLHLCLQLKKDQGVARRHRYLLGYRPEYLGSQDLTDQLDLADYQDYLEF
jgi:hypothetical protein